jgi:hypothetical protein
MKEFTEIRTVMQAVLDQKVDSTTGSILTGLYKETGKRLELAVKTALAVEAYPKVADNLTSIGAINTNTTFEKLSVPHKLTLTPATYSKEPNKVVTNKPILVPIHYLGNNLYYLLKTEVAFTTTAHRVLQLLESGKLEVYGVRNTSAAFRRGQWVHIKDNSRLQTKDYTIAFELSSCIRISSKKFESFLPTDNNKENNL